jgi:hypothetical protein
LFKSFALADSLSRYGGVLHLLLTDEDKPVQGEIPKNIRLHQLREISDPRLASLKKKYGRQTDRFRWGLKPLFLRELLKEFREVIYLDNDIYFLNDPSLLFAELADHRFLLTPHFYPDDPLTQPTWLEANFRIGLYNAGFIGANQEGREILNWWVDCCLYELKRAYWRGLFDDQKYLDLVPVKFSGVKILKERGYNFAGWNDNSGLSKEEITFIHFNPFTLKKFGNPENRYHTLFQNYLTHLKQYRQDYNWDSKLPGSFEWNNAWYFLRWKVCRLLNL